jgi:hypothetical protein
MRLALSVLSLAVTAVGLSMQVQPGVEECYFLDVDRATSKHKIITSFEVISGDITVDLRVTGPPDDKQYHQISGKAQERFLFDPEISGVYELCFSNFASAGTVGFSVHPEDEEYPDVALKGRLLVHCRLSRPSDFYNRLLHRRAHYAPRGCNGCFIR